MAHDTVVDELVLGAGPAGLQLAWFLERAGRDYVVLEAGSAPGTFFRTFPRHRQLISINKTRTGSDDPEVNLRMDWNSLLSDDPALRFTAYSRRYFPPADDLLRYLADFAGRTGLRVRYGTRIERIDREGERGRFILTDRPGNTWRARRLIVATGLTRPHEPAIPGIETAERYWDVSVDPDDFTDQRVLIVGKGNSAFETADNLVETAAVIHVAGPGSIRMAWRSHFVGHLRAVNNNFLDTYQLKSQNALLDGDVLRIERRPGGYVVSFRFVRADEIVKDIAYDRVIVCTGFRFDADLFAPACRPDLVIDDRFPAQTPEWRSTNVEDLYFAGTLMQARDYKRSTSGFIHGFRYGVRALHRILERRYHGADWPARSLPADADALAAAVIERVNRTSALWQQFGVLADVIVVPDGGDAHYQEEMPLDHLREREGAGLGRWFAVTLEYGDGHDLLDPFDVTVGRVGQGDRGAEGRYLHPVVRSFRGAELLATHHVTENLENEWDGPHHRDPLRDFLAGQLGPAAVAAPV